MEDNQTLKAPINGTTGITTAFEPSFFEEIKRATAEMKMLSKSAHPAIVFKTICEGVGALSNKNDVFGGIPTIAQAAFEDFVITACEKAKELLP